MNDELSAPKITLINNPLTSSKRYGRYLEEFKGLLKDRWEFISVTTEHRRVAIQVKGLCENGFNRIIVAGGDGTIMESVNGIISSGKDSVLGVIPQGTGNDLARAIGFYKMFKEDPSRYLNGLAKKMAEPGSMTCRILLLKTSPPLEEMGHPLHPSHQIFFTNYLGIGFDAKVVREFHRRRPLTAYTPDIPFMKMEWRFCNRLIYLFCIIGNLFYKIRAGIEILYTTQHGERREMSVKDIKNILLLNIPSYAGGTLNQKEIDCNGDNFQLIIVKSIWEFLYLILKDRMPAIALKILPEPEIHTIKEIQINFSEGLKNYIQIDGEDYTCLTDRLKQITIKNAVRIRVFNI
ncbi:MAG: hypothetical protein A2889_03565 [Nitrospinae bacterium RIFCSPLOWO2_01_FULL_39_10]|nr:MAG: hypothetical protein A2889_03565 [Nitrospinae bacterium RIFCSPLOWO2_01_FULL_39_10]